MKFIGYLKGLSEGYAIRSENSAFEVPHVHDVAYYSEKLAYERGLDPNIALVIAYGHDLGRTKLGVNGKDHARVSAKFMKALMTASELDEYTQDVIANAIKKHNKKSKCHDVYSELIKDADALAHQDEGLISEDDQIETYRVVISNMGDLSIEVASIEMWCEQYESHRATFLKNMMHLELFKEDSKHWIHEQRKNVRKLRSMIWYLKFGNSENRFDALDALLKQFFDDLSSARMIQVQIDHLRKLSALQSTLTDELKQSMLEEALKNELDRIEHRLTTDFYSELVSVFNQTFDLVAENFEDPIKNQNRWLSSFTTYLDKATKTDSKKLKALHEMRIHGKKFKYLHDMGLLYFSSQKLDVVIDHLHDHIGALNDLGDIKKMKQWQVFYEASMVEIEIKRIQKLCKDELFFLVKLNHMMTSKHLPIVNQRSNNVI